MATSEPYVAMIDTNRAAASYGLSVVMQGSVFICEARSKAYAKKIAAALNGTSAMLATLKKIKAANYECLAPSVCRAENRLCIPCVVGDAIAKAEGK